MDEIETILDIIKENIETEEIEYMTSTIDRIAINVEKISPQKRISHWTTLNKRPDHVTPSLRFLLPWWPGGLIKDLRT